MLRLEACRSRSGRGPARRAVRPRGEAPRRRRRPGDRLRGREVGPGRAQDRRDAHVHRARRRAICTRSTRCTAISASSGRHDVAIVLSKSGESQDLFGLVGSLQRLGVPIIAITGAARLDAGPRGDGGAGRLAWPRRPARTTWRPTSSTTVALALGDALAVALLEARDSAARTSRRSTRAGSLGRRLLLRVRDVMLPPGRCSRPTPPCATPW